MRIVLIGIVALLSSCAWRTNVVMKRELKALVGKDVHAVIAKLGYPRTQQVVAGDKIYTWERNDCVLNVGVDATEHIVRYDYQGTRRECSAFADTIDR